MKRYDGHIHLNTLDICPQHLLSRLEDAGLSGACLISMEPAENNPFHQLPGFSQRLDHVLAFCENHREQLFPLLWIHPDEDGILSKVDEAIDRGILGFKMICNNYYVYEDKCMALLERIAAAEKPVLFHSGILWDGNVSSNYNKPVNWECCLEIPKLRFALAHCSWPWYDECIALYGKFLNAMTLRGDQTAEMFIDITPGTPPVYRKEVLMKLHGCAYDIQNNILFGTDCQGHDYSVAWSRQWQDRDDGIYDALGIDQQARRLIYGENLKRFLGLIPNTVQHKAQKPDGSFETK